MELKLCKVLARKRTTLTKASLAFKRSCHICSSDTAMLPNKCPKQASSPHNGSLAVNADRGCPDKVLEVPQD